MPLVAIAPIVTLAIALLRAFVPLPKKATPVIAALGGIAATLVAVPAAGPLAQQIAEGVLAGLAATGLYEVAKQARRAVRGGDAPPPPPPAVVTP